MSQVTLLNRDRIDTLRIWQFPVVLGTGKRLFGEGAIPRAFRLADTRQTATGAVLHVTSVPAASSTAKWKSARRP